MAEYKVKGYHGTDYQSALSIQNSKIKLSLGDKKWLGDGAYFFEEDMEMAVEWCLTQVAKNYNKFAVLGVDIQVNEEHVLDLTTHEGRKLFRWGRKLLIERISRSDNKGYVIQDGKVINYLCNQFKGRFKVIKGDFFVKTSENFMMSNSRIPNCTIISVRNINCIKGKPVIIKKWGEIDGC